MIVWKGKTEEKITAKEVKKMDSGTIHNLTSKSLVTKS